MTTTPEADDKTKIERDFAQWCEACGQQCCRASVPYLADWERKKLEASLGSRSFAFTLDSHGQSLNLFKNKRKRCVFLMQNGHCSIQNQKPLVCQIFPLTFYWDGIRIRWFVTLFCPAAKNFADNYLRNTFTQARKATKRWSPRWIPKYNCRGLLVELTKEHLEQNIDELLGQCKKGHLRDRTIDGSQKSYCHADSGLQIPISVGQRLKIDLEHPSFFKARLDMEISLTPLEILVTDLAWDVSEDDLATEYSNWGNALFNDFRVISKKNQRIQDFHSCSLETVYADQGQPVKGIRHYLVKDKRLYFFSCQSKLTDNWEEIKKEFFETKARVSIGKHISNSIRQKGA